MIPLLLTFALCWQPTIDRQRIELDYVAEPPYWLGIVASNGLTFEVSAYQGGELILDYSGGCEWYLYYNDLPDPIYFYEGENYVGKIVPEPSILTLFLISAALLRRKGGVLWSKQRHIEKHPEVPQKFLLDGPKKQI